MSIDEQTVRRFYRRLHHGPHGRTELVAIDKDTGRLLSTGLFDDETAFIAACRLWNPHCHIYAGRNPRPDNFSAPRNTMDALVRKRARDQDIRQLTAMSLDIDPVRAKGSRADDTQHRAAIEFALAMQADLGGSVDDSGNGAYLWLPFKTPIALTEENFEGVKQQCAGWQQQITEKYKPDQFGLKIDGCFDHSRLKRVIGTYNHRARRNSRIVKQHPPDDTILKEIVTRVILSMESGKATKWGSSSLPPQRPLLPERFKHLLVWDTATRELWHKPDPLNDTSRHDWMLGGNCVEAGITEPKDLAAILMHSPHGKYKRDLRSDYVAVTVRKLLAQCCLERSDSNR